MKSLLKKSRHTTGLFTGLTIDHDFNEPGNAKSLFFLAHLAGFNRTIVELKFVSDKSIGRAACRFNRTIVELKSST